MIADLYREIFKTFLRLKENIKFFLTNQWKSICFWAKELLKRGKESYRWGVFWLPKRLPRSVALVANVIVILYNYFTRDEFGRMFIS